MIYINQQKFLHNVYIIYIKLGANVPISVILVGVGDFDFKKLEFLD